MTKSLIDELVIDLSPVKILDFKKLLLISLICFSLILIAVLYFYGLRKDLSSIINNCIFFTKNGSLFIGLVASVFAIDALSRPIEKKSYFIIASPILIFAIITYKIFELTRLGVDTLIIVELSEFNLYRVDQELRSEFPSLTLHSVLGDCGDRPLIEQVHREHSPQIVIHAAAYKHVPLLERQSRQAVRNNVLATQSFAQAAHAHGVSAFLLTSSDKAVNPANVMGATKRVGEMICQRPGATWRDAVPDGPFWKRARFGRQCCAVVS